MYMYSQRRGTVQIVMLRYTHNTHNTHTYIYMLLKRSRFVCAKNQKINNEIVRNIDNNNIHK